MINLTDFSKFYNWLACLMRVEWQQLSLPQRVLIKGSWQRHNRVNIRHGVAEKRSARDEREVGSRQKNPHGGVGNGFSSIVS
ncbi:hypothetical protein D3C72_1809820 [compost metagenome]